MTYVSDAVAHLAERLDEYAGQSIRYYRGSTYVDEVTAWPGQEEVEQVTDGEMTLVSRRRTWTFDPAVLVFDGIHGLPTRGDRIEWDTNGTTYKFEVLPADGENDHIPWDAYGNRIRVNAKLVDQE